MKKVIYAILSFFDDVNVDFDKFEVADHNSEVPLTQKCHLDQFWRTISLKTIFSDETYSRNEFPEPKYLQTNNFDANQVDSNISHISYVQITRKTPRHPIKKIHHTKKLHFKPARGAMNALSNELLL